MASSSVQPIERSILTRQAKAALRAWGRAKALFDADRVTGIAPADVPFDLLTPLQREPYLAIAEGELASSTPQFPVRDETVGRDQVTRAERATARVLAFGGRRV